LGDKNAYTEAAVAGTLSPQVMFAAPALGLGLSPGGSSGGRRTFQLAELAIPREDYVRTMIERAQRTIMPSEFLEIAMPVRMLLLLLLLVLLLLWLPVLLLPLLRHPLLVLTLSSQADERPLAWDSPKAARTTKQLQSCIERLLRLPDLSLRSNSGKSSWHSWWHPSPLTIAKVREHSSAEERCEPHVAIFPAMLRSSNRRSRSPRRSGATTPARWCLSTRCRR